MRLSLPRLALGIFLVAQSTAFLTPQVRLHPSQLSALTTTETQHHHHHHHRATTTSLRMGMWQDFLSGSKQRNKANEAYLQQLADRVDRINALEASVEDLGDDELTAKTADFRKRLAAGEDLNGPLLEEAFAVVREAAWYV